MAQYTINSPGSSNMTLPSTLSAGDILVFNWSPNPLAWSPPEYGTYKITAYGAKGGGTNGGAGGIVQGTLTLLPTDVVQLSIYAAATGASGGTGGGPGGNGGYSSAGENGYRGGKATLCNLNGALILAAAGGGGQGGKGGDTHYGTTTLYGTSGGAGSPGGSGQDGNPGTGTGGGAGGTVSSPGGQGGKGGKVIYSNKTYSGQTGSDGAPGDTPYDGSGGGGGGGATWASSGQGGFGGGGGRGGDNYLDSSLTDSSVLATFNTGDGRVEIAVVSVAQNKYLIQDGNDIKAFVSGAWTTVGQEPITKAMFDSYGMTDLSVLTDAALRQLNSTSPQLLCWTDETGSPSRTQIITGIPPAKLILPIGDIEVPDGIDSVNLDVTTSGFGKVIIVVSVDGGLTWQSHALGGWTPVDISYLENVGANGMLPDQVNALTADEWAALGVTDKIRFAYYLDQLYSTDTAQVNSLTINERQYTLTPTVSSLDVIYKLLNASNPTFYVSRDDGVTWKEVEPDTLVDLTDLPSGNQIRIKAVLQSGQEIYGYSYSWV